MGWNQKKGKRMAEYDQETLDKLHKLELNILSDFIDLCNRHDLCYFGMAGTGIGAVRHGGFIPWDDDIDVALLRDDYEEFLRIAKTELADRYELLNFEENSNYPLMSTRLMLKGTEFREYALKDIDCPLGVFLDIYAFDNIPDDEALFRKQARDAFLWSKLLILRSIPFPVLPYGGVKARFTHLACGMIHLVLVLFRVSKQRIYDRCYEVSTRYRDTGATLRVDYLCDTNAYMNIISREDLLPTRELPFDGLMVAFPNNLDNYLTGMYGDYMTLPPEGKRKNHFPFRLDFGKWA